MISFRDLVSGFRQLDLERSAVVMAHASLSAFGEVKGGPETLLAALFSVINGVMMPAFTYKTMLTPEIGPKQNGIRYGSESDQNRMAEFYRKDMRVDATIGIVPETLRNYPQSGRSMHPILSFTGVNAEKYLAAQTLAEPLAPVRELYTDEGWVLLMGVNHTCNTSIHFAERLAGRRQFTRWALTYAGVVECPGFSGCSEGFETIAPFLAPITRKVTIGSAQVQAIPLRPMVEEIVRLLEEEPGFLLCSRPDCERCTSVRETLLLENQS